MNCISCLHWLIARKTRYVGSGEVITNWQAGTDAGTCLRLHVEVPADFGCNKYTEAEVGDDHIEWSEKDGEPWQHWHWGPCPDCNSPGRDAVGGLDTRCAGTGRVRHYDDGYVGEEQTRLHPKEKVHGEMPARQATCFNCHKGIDETWVACPHCGKPFKRHEGKHKDIIDQTAGDIV